MKPTSLGAFAQRHRLALSLCGIVAACAVLLPACNSPLDSLSHLPQTMTLVVTSTPTTGTVLVGATRQYAIEVRDATAAVLPITAATWSLVGTAGIATITQDGLATCAAAGTITVHAVGPAGPSATTLTADASLECVAPPGSVATTMTLVVTSTPATGTVFTGATRQYAIDVRDQSNVLLTAFTTATWSIVGTAGIATITQLGLATCVTAGTVTVHAIGPVNGSGVNLTADASLQCAAPPSVPTTMTLVVTSTPATGTVLIGATRQYAIDVRDQSNVLLTTFTTATWSIVGTAGIATITQSGLATCVAAGTITVHAVGPANGSGVNLTADASLQCVPPPSVATTMTILVTSTPGTGTVLVGTTRQYAIDVRDQFNALMTAFTTATWSIVGTAGVAAINQQGLATCLASGTITVHAVGPVNGAGVNLTADASLQCVPPPTVTSVVVTPPASNCVVGNTIQFTAKAFDGTGAEVVGAVSNWSADTVRVATVNNAGLVNCLAAGSTKIRAFAGSGAGAPGGSADLTVLSNSTVASIHVTAMHTFLTVAGAGGSANSTTQLTATAFNAAGVQIQNVVFVWGGGNAAASVSGSGLVTALASGGALITASSGGVSGTGAITVGNMGAIMVPMVNANGSPAEGAILSASAGAAGGAITGVTGFNGMGFIPGLSPGTYTVTVALTGYVTQTFTGIVVTAQAATALPNPITMHQ